MERHADQANVTRILETISALPDEQRELLIGLVKDEYELTMDWLYDSAVQEVTRLKAETEALKRLVRKQEAKIVQLRGYKPGPRLSTMKLYLLAYARARWELKSTYLEMQPAVNRVASKFGLPRYGNAKSIEVAISKVRSRDPGFAAKVCATVETLKRSGL